MMIFVIFMPASVMVAKFQETVRLLVLSKELNRLSATDALTRFKRCHAFIERLQNRLERAAPLTLILADLDGFNAARSIPAQARSTFTDTPLCG